MSLPKILTLTIPVWNSQSGSDTFTNLLSGYDAEKVANIYFKSGVPDSAACEKYFFISENAVIKSVLKRSLKTGREVERGISDKNEVELNLDDEINVEKQRYSFFSRHRWWILLFAREILWKAGLWNSKDLNDFVESFSPDALFFPIEGYLYFNRITRYLLDKIKVPAVGIIWDDNFTYKVHPYNLGFRLHRYFLRRQVKNLAERCSILFTIDSKMQRELEQEFGIKSEILTKGAHIPEEVPAGSTYVAEKKIVYTGKLNLGRLESVIAVADAIEKSKSGNAFTMYVYSGTSLTDQEKQRLERRGTHFMGHVTQDKIPEIQRNADILLMAEAMEGKHKYDARLSFSTKIVDYLSQGKCILAVGPGDIAPMEYLKEERAAIVASSKKELSEIFEEGYITEQLIVEYSHKAITLARKNHNIKEIQARLYSSFENAIQEYNHGKR